MSQRFEVGNKEDAFAIRQKVFVDEQGFSEEFDDLDAVATHLTLIVDEVVVGCARILKCSEDPAVCILGRFALVPEMRKQGYGRQLVEQAEELAQSEGAHEVRLHAQCRAVPFYEQLGYSAFGVIEPEEHIDHIWMKKDIPNRE